MSRVRTVAAVAAFFLASTDISSATPLLTNLLVNGDAESGAGSASGNDVIPIPGWTSISSFTVVQYGAPAFPDAAVSTAIAGGNNFFGGGPGTNFSSASQTLNVGDLAASIDAGTISVTLSGDVGGFEGQDDNMMVTASFLDGSSAVLTTLSIGPVTQSDRLGLTTLLFRTQDGSVPIGTRSIIVEMDATRFQGAYDDGYADNLSLVLGGAGSPPSDVPEPASLSILAAGLAMFAASRRRAKR